MDCEYYKSGKSENNESNSSSSSSSNTTQRKGYKNELCPYLITFQDLRAATESEKKFATDLFNVITMTREKCTKESIEKMIGSSNEFNGIITIVQQLSIFLHAFFKEVNKRNRKANKIANKKNIDDKKKNKKIGKLVKKNRETLNTFVTNFFGIDVHAALAFFNCFFSNLNNIQYWWIGKNAIEIYTNNMKFFENKQK